MRSVALLLLLALALLVAGCGESKRELRTLHVDPASIERVQRELERQLESCAGRWQQPGCVVPRVTLRECASADRSGSTCGTYRLVTREPIEPDAMDRAAAFLRRLMRLESG